MLIYETEEQNYESFSSAPLGYHERADPVSPWALASPATIVNKRGSVFMPIYMVYIFAGICKLCNVELLLCAEC